MMDRIDLQVEAPPVTPADLSLPPPPEGTAEAAARVAAAREAQRERLGDSMEGINAVLDGDALTKTASPDEAGAALLAQACESLRLTARGYVRVLRVARTVADLDGAGGVRRRHVAEALSFRRIAAPEDVRLGT